MPNMIKTQNAHKKPPPTPTSIALTLAERRAWIWASERFYSAHPGAVYWLCSRVLTEDNPLTSEDDIIQKRGVKATFDYLHGHANIERAPHGTWAVGHSAYDTRLVFDDIYRATTYSEMLREMYLAEDPDACKTCITCGADLTAAPEV
jgi:hypothetical protein